MAREYHDDENMMTPEDVLERERVFAQEEKIDQADALSHLYTDKREAEGE